MIKVSDLFDVIYGVNLEFQSMEIYKHGIPFVSRTEKNNGVVGFVKRIDTIEPNPKNTISVACGGSVMESFFQAKEYYSGRDLFYLKPKVKLTERQMLYYCMCLRANKYRYSYGRQANKTLKNILIPMQHEIPDYVDKLEIKMPSANSLNESRLKLNLCKWKSFKLLNFFDMFAGEYYEERVYKSGKIPLISASDSNNGIMKLTNLPSNYENCLTIGKNWNYGLLSRYSICR